MDCDDVDAVVEEEIQNDGSIAMLMMTALTVLTCPCCWCPSWTLSSLGLENYLFSLFHFSLGQEVVYNINVRVATPRDLGSVQE